MKTHVLFAASLCLLIPNVVPAAVWAPVTDAELSQKTPRVDPAADAEAIFWDVKIEDRVQGEDLSLTLNHYLRLKIFNERGKEKFATVEIEEPAKTYIREIAGRTIKPNGTILELKKDAIFDRELAKAKGLKLKGKSFTLPNVEVGDIIEYQYRETRDNEVAQYMRLYFQREIPIWKVSYHLKPLNLPYLPYAMRSMAFQCNHGPFQKEPDGFYTTSLSNVPAFVEEPYMPPEDQLRAWVLIYYEEDKKIDAEKYWKDTGRRDFAQFKPLISANGDVKKTATELVSGATDPMEKLARLEAFCRTKIENYSLTSSRMTAEQRKAMKDNNSPGDTLKRKAGWGSDINFLFASLASAAGFDARMARIPDRGDTFFDPNRPLTYFMRAISVAVKVNDKWLFFDPSTPYLEKGMLRWQEEGVDALVSDPKEGFFVKTQYTEPLRSLKKRRANMKLLENGTLEGEVEYSYSGHVSVDQKRKYDDMTAAQREEDWKQSLQDRLSTAEMSNFQMSDAEDLTKPLVVRHNVSIPGYATRTGKRILFQPAFFQRNYSARFTEAKRKFPVYFDYGWAEDDQVTIELPDGWELDKPVAPQNARFGATGEYSTQALKSPDGRKLTYSRKLEFGRGMTLIFPTEGYPQLKNVFDFMYEQDNYTIALKAADAK